jgi:uncharacterized protein YjbI with pentapeptide repeats
MKKILLLSITLLAHHFTYSRTKLDCIHIINNTRGMTEENKPNFKNPPNLKDTDLSGCSLHFFPPKPVNFQNAHLEETTMAGLNLTDADFSNATFSSPTSLRKTSFDSCTFTNTKFDKAKMANTIFSHCTFIGCSFDGCSFNEENQSPTSFSNCNFHNNGDTPNKFSNIDNGQKMNLNNSIIHGTLSIEKCKFNNSNMTQLIAENIIITDSIIDNSNFTMYAPISDSDNLTESNAPHIKNLTIKNGSAKNLIFENVVIGDETEVTETDSTGAIFDHTDLSATSFKNSTMKKTLFSAPVLGANFEGTNLTGSIVDLNCYKTFNSLWFATIEKDGKPTNESLTTVTSVNPRGEVYTRTQIDNIVERIKSSQK